MDVSATAYWCRHPSRHLTTTISPQTGNFTPLKYDPFASNRSLIVGRNFEQYLSQPWSARAPATAAAPESVHDLREWARCAHPRCPTIAISIWTSQNSRSEITLTMSTNTRRRFNVSLMPSVASRPGRPSRPYRLASVHLAATTNARGMRGLFALTIPYHKGVEHHDPLQLTLRRGPPPRPSL